MTKFPFCLTLAALAAAVTIGAGSARANDYTLNLPFDLSTGTYNPFYGDIFFNAPGDAGISNPITFQAGDDLTINYSYLPGQALEIQNTGAGISQSLDLDLFDDFVWGAQGTYTLTLQGVQGDPLQTVFNGSLDGANFLFVWINQTLTDSEFSFTGFTVNVAVTGISDSYGDPGTTFTTNSYEFQAYGDQVTPLFGQQPPTNPVPDGGAMWLLGLIALGGLALYSTCAAKPAL